MNIKTNIRIAISAALIVFCSCSRVLPEFSEPEKEYNLTVSLQNLPTKSTSMDNASESSAAHLQVLVFAENGKLEDMVSGTGGIHTVRCSRGYKKVAVLVNAPAFAGSSFDDIKNPSVSIGDYTPGALVMYGETDIEVTNNSNVNITVRRTCSRAIVSKITNMYSGSAGGLTLDGIYLSNMRASVSPDGTAVGDVWTNKLGVRDEDSELFDDTISAHLDISGQHSVEHRFYALPNPQVQDTYLDTWAPRHTRLVHETTMGGNKRYYPLTLPVIQANYSYHIEEAVIMSEGCDKPEDVLPFAYIRVSEDGVEDYTWGDDSVVAGGGTLVFTDNGLDAMDYVFGTLTPITDDCIVIVISDGTVSPFSFETENMHAVTDAAMRIVVTTGSAEVFGDMLEKLLALTDDAYAFFFQDSELQNFINGNEYRYQLTLDNQCFSFSWEDGIPSYGEDDDNCIVN